MSTWLMDELNKHFFRFITPALRCKTYGILVLFRSFPRFSLYREQARRQYTRFELTEIIVIYLFIDVHEP